MNTIFAIIFIVSGVILGNVLGIHMTINVVIKSLERYFKSLGYSSKESLDMAIAILKKRGNLE